MYNAKINYEHLWTSWFVGLLDPTFRIIPSAPAPWTRSEESQPHGPKQMDPYLTMASVWHFTGLDGLGVSQFGKKNLGVGIPPIPLDDHLHQMARKCGCFSGRPVDPNFRETHLENSTVYVFHDVTSQILIPQFPIHPITRNMIAVLFMEMGNINQPKKWISTYFNLHP